MGIDQARLRFSNPPCCRGLNARAGLTVASHGHKTATASRRGAQVERCECSRRGAARDAINAWRRAVTAGRRQVVRAAHAAPCSWRRVPGVVDQHVSFAARPNRRGVGRALLRQTLRSLVARQLSAHQLLRPVAAGCPEPVFSKSRSARTKGPMRRLGTSSLANSLTKWPSASGPQGPQESSLGKS